MNKYTEQTLPFPILWPDYKCCGLFIEDSQKDHYIIWTDSISNRVIRARCGICGKGYKYEKDND